MGRRARELAALRELERQVWGRDYYARFCAEQGLDTSSAGRARRLALAGVTSGALAVPWFVSLGGAASPATFTTDVHGDAVNANHYAAKCDVYVDGGPDGAVLRDGSYFFAVLAPGGQSDPRGPKLLSSDSEAARSFTVVGGSVQYDGVHPTSTDDDNGELLMSFCVPGAPDEGYADTPNPGGVYIAAICRDVPDPRPRDCKYDAFKVEGAGPTTSTTAPGGSTTTAPGGTTTTAPGGTTTSAPATTTTSTTSPPPTTSTTGGATSTSAPPTSSTTTPEATTTSTTPGPPVTPLGPTVPTSATAPPTSGPPGDLARTGGGTTSGEIVAVGLFSAALGSVLAATRRRQRLA
jgi:hypothetical protein